MSATRERSIIDSLVNRISSGAIRHWLKCKGKTHSFNNKRDLADLLCRLVADSQNGISLRELLDVSVAIEENGSKSIYLYKLMGDISHLTNREAFEAFLRVRKLFLSTERTLAIQLPNKPKVNYVIWSSEGIRVKWTETHQKIGDMDFSSETFVKKPVTKIIVLVFDFRTRLVRVQIDESARLHDHLDLRTMRPSKKVYIDHYVNEAKNILGVTSFSKYELLSVATVLVKNETNFIHLLGEVGATAENSRFRMFADLGKELRKDKSYSAGVAMNRGNNSTDNVHFYWLPEYSEGRITRPVPMMLDSTSNMIRFNADCLEIEVDYAISKIREIQSHLS